MGGCIFTTGRVAILPWGWEAKGAYDLGQRNASNITMCGSKGRRPPEWNLPLVATYMLVGDAAATAAAGRGMSAAEGAVRRGDAVVLMVGV